MMALVWSMLCTCARMMGESRTAGSCERPQARLRVAASAAVLQRYSRGVDSSMRAPKAQRGPPAEAQGRGTAAGCRLQAAGCRLHAEVSAELAQPL